jgi:hypothetical protein
MPITVVMRSQVCTTLNRSNNGIMGSNPSGGVAGCMNFYVSCCPAYVGAL